MVFLQTGIRVSELCNLRLGDVDLEARVIRVRGKGMTTREIELGKKGVQAIKNYLATRPVVLDDHLFLNRFGAPSVERGVRRVVVSYPLRAGIT
jgi:site-specific recombinase XerD